jgi:hypothetical protein
MPVKVFFVLRSAKMKHSSQVVNTAVSYPGDQTWAQRTATLSEKMCDFPQSHQENATIVP